MYSTALYHIISYGGGLTMIMVATVKLPRQHQHVFLFYSGSRGTCCASTFDRDYNLVLHD